MFFLINIYLYLFLNLNLDSQVIKYHIKYFRLRKKQDQAISS